MEDYIAKHMVWPQPPSLVKKELQNESERKRILLIKRYFDRLEARGSRQEEEPELQVRLTFKPQYSVTDRESSRGDESFQDIYGLIR